MAYYALITIDLHKQSTTNQRQKFHHELEQLGWIKVSKSTTAWEVHSPANDSYDDMVEDLIADIKSTKNQAKIQAVSYSIQLGRNEAINDVITT